jgi:hypothetical protein
LPPNGGVTLNVANIREFRANAQPGRHKIIKLGGLTPAPGSQSFPRSSDSLSSSGGAGCKRERKMSGFAFAVNIMG